MNNSVSGTSYNNGADVLQAIRNHNKRLGEKKPRWSKKRRLEMEAAYDAAMREKRAAAGVAP